MSVPTTWTVSDIREVRGRDLIGIRVDFPHPRMEHIFDRSKNVRKTNWFEHTGEPTAEQIQNSQDTLVYWARRKHGIELTPPQPGEIQLSYKETK